MFIGNETITETLKYIEDIEKQLADSTANSVIREKIEAIKSKASETEKTRENVMFFQGYYKALEEILEGEK